MRLAISLAIALLGVGCADIVGLEHSQDDRTATGPATDEDATEPPKTTSATMEQGRKCLPPGERLLQSDLKPCCSRRFDDRLRCL
jgi:hypothetical protein